MTYVVGSFRTSFRKIGRKVLLKAVLQEQRLPLHFKNQNEAYKKEKASLVGYRQFLDENAWQYFGSKIIELVTKTK
jgi:hypothetical protein